MNKQTEDALKMAIEWFEGLIKANAPIYDEERLILNACKEALEQPAQEPVAYLCDGTRFKVTGVDNDSMITGLPAKLAGEWVALVLATDNRHLTYAHPTQPLSDDEIYNFVNEYEETKNKRGMQDITKWFRFARAIEQAHGIGVTDR